jgi:hypothetical protein
VQPIQTVNAGDCDDASRPEIDDRLTLGKFALFDKRVAEMLWGAQELLHSFKAR